MKPATIIGIVLVVLGAIALARDGISYTKTDKIVDLGPIQIEKKEKKTIPVPPILGGIAVLGGIALIVAGAKS